jgi:hypothetical protein
MESCCVDMFGGMCNSTTLTPATPPGVEFGKSRFYEGTPINAKAKRSPPPAIKSKGKAPPPAAIKAKSKPSPPPPAKTPKLSAKPSPPPPKKKVRGPPPLVMLSGCGIDNNDEEVEVEVETLLGG